MACDIMIPKTTLIGVQGESPNSIRRLVYL
jgi:hypothetical protein